MTEIEGVLRTATSRVLEDLCFASVEATPRPVPPSWDMVGTVHFSGDRSGYLAVRLHGVDVGKLAEAMLGEEEVLDERLMMDAVGELANIVCGNVLPDVVGHRTSCDLMRPTVVCAVASEPVAGSRAILVGVEDGVCQIELMLEDGGAPS